MGSLGTNEPIAIVGMACRLPGDISSPCELWDFLAQEKSGQSDFPKNRLNIDSWYHPDSQRPGSISTKGGYFLSDGDSFRHFDPSFFRISPLEAASMDPQQRKLLEVVYESFESAGIGLQDVAGSNTGCFVGNFTWDVGQMQARDVEYSTPYEMTGGGLTILSNRVNYVFDLKGPSLTLDTACSSTMYALHLACKSLQAGECSAAVVGGTNIIFGVEQQIGSVKLGTLSPTSICHTFDEAADGYARGEAVGSVHIKRLSDAIRDNNPIRAIIRATAVNTNGRGLGMNRPITFDQEAVIRKAYASAGLDFDHTAYLESHGTGTPTGDPIEFSAIGNVFGPLHQPDTPLLIGSVKPNLGHGEAASTIPSLIKTVLSLEKAEIPATIGIRTFNPKLGFHGGRLKIVQKLTPWPAEQGYRRASVNSFGYGGANAHAILDAAESYLGQISTQIHRLPSPEIRAPPTSPQSYYLLPFSAHNQQTLEKNFAAMSEVCNTFHLRDLAYTLSTGRSSLPVRGFTVVAESQDGTVGHLLSDTVLKTAEQEAGAPGLAFVFTGQGAQWPRMAMSLIDGYPSVLESIKEMDDILAMLPEPPTWTILETLSASKMTSRINDADRSQTVCTAVQVSIVRLLRPWGINAKANVGHSSGEIAAAFASGYLTLRQAIIIAYLRGQAVARNNIPGAMLAVGLGAAEVTQFIEPLTDICIACHNSPNSVTLSGTTAAIDEAHGIFSRLGVFSRKLVTSGNAYHSQLMSLAGIDYEDQLLQRLSHEEAPTPGTTSPIMVSSVTGTTVTSGLDLQYWRRNLESPVLFSQAVQRLVEEMPDARLLVEIGPHSALGGPIKEIRSGLGLGANRLQYLSTLKRNSNGVENMLNLGGSLYLSGYPVALNRLNAHCETSEKPRYITEIPRYQWVYDELHWSESRLSAEIRFRDHPRHDLLGSLLPGCSKSSPSWRNIIELKELPWIDDHKVGEDIVFPAAGYVSLAIAAASQATGLPFQQNSYTLQNVKIKSAMVMKQGVGTEMIVDLRVLESPHADFDFAVSTVTAGKWMVHAAGTIRVHSDSIPTVFANQPAGSSLQTHPNGVNQATQDRRWYYKMGQVGLVYGPSFRTLSNIRSTTTENEAVADVTCHLDEAYTAHASAYLIHPTIIDACLQLSIIAAHEGDPDNLVKSYLPVAIEQMTIFGPTIGRNSIQPAAIRGRGIPKGLRSIETVVELTDGGGDVLLEARLSFLSLESSINSQSQSRVPQPYSRLVWKPSINHLSSDQLRSLLTTPALNTGFMDPLGNLMDLIAHSDPRLNIIELGEVSVGPSLSILSALQGESDVPNYVKYVFVSTATELLTASEDGFKAYKNLHFQGFDMTKDISSQGFDEGALDVAVAPADLLVRGEFSQFLAMCDRLLKPDGRLIVTATSNPESPATNGQFSLESAWGQRLTEAGFSGACEISSESTGPGSFPSFIVAQKNHGHHKRTLNGVNGTHETHADDMANGVEKTNGVEKKETPILLLYDHEPHPLVHEIEKICAERLIPTKRLPFTDYPNISSDNTRTIMLAELEAPLLSRMTEADMKAMQHYTQTASTSVWVTNCDVLVGKEPEKTLVFGIAKSIMTEQPSFRIASIDVDPDATEAVQLSASARLVMDLEDKFHRHVEGMDTEVVEKQGIVYTSRYIGDEVGNAEFAQTFNPEPKVAPIRENLSLAFDKIGRLGSYYFSDTEASTGSVGDDEIVVESRAFGFDQTGVAIAKGQKNHPFFSSEAGGIVLKTGKLVQSVQPGDRVVCLKPNKFETTVVVKEGLCLPIKPTDEFSDIVGQLLPFTFAIHTLREACQLDEQSRVLVDVTSPCLSLAVAQVALLTTPDVYATWASEEQKSMLSNLPGIKLVELSSLPDISVSIIVTNGELEMGAPLRRIADRAARLALLAGRSFTDLAGLSSSLMEKQLRISYHDPMQMTSLGDGISKALQQTMQCWGNGAIKPVPSQAYDLSNFAEAASSIFATQAQAVLTCSPGATKVPIKSLPRPLKFDDSASYLLIGCLGGLGRSLTMWMISRGARNFVFLSRSGADKPEAAALAAELRGMVGVTIQIVRGDVTKRQDVAAAIAEARQPIKGVVQAAMVLHELLFTELTLKQWKQVIDSKVAGTINLHELLLDHDLDFFVMCSSVLGAIGAATQSNYAAANSFLDAMARHRHSLGLQAASVALGMILDVGHVEEHPEVETALKRNGMYGIGVSEYLHAMELGCRGRQRPQDGEHPLSITTNGTTTATSSAPPPGWWGYYDAAAAAHIVTGMDPTRVTRAGGKGMWLSDNRLRNLLLALGDDQSGADPESSSSSSSQSVTARLRAAAVEGEGGREAVRMVVQQLFMERLSKLVLLPVAKMTPSSPLSLYGMDSMISAELRSWAWKEFKANIPFMSLLDHSLTFEGLAELAVSLMDADSGAK